MSTYLKDYRTYLITIPLAGLVVALSNKNLRRRIFSLFGVKSKTENKLPKRESGSTPLHVDFDRACDIVGQARKLSTDEQLQFYGLYKQATVGDNNKPKPSAINMAEAAKWEAWKSRAGLSKEEAMKQYIELQKNLLGDVKPVTTKKVDPDDPDDLFMTEEEYQEMRKHKMEKGAVGTTLSKGTLIGEEVPTIEGSENNDVQEFFQAIEEEQLDKIEELIKKGFNLKQYNSAGLTGLHYAVDAEKEQALDLLLKHYEDCDVQDINGDTPLHVAVNLENEEFIKKLLEHKVDPNKANKAGETPANLASKSLKHLFETA